MARYKKKSGSLGAVALIVIAAMVLSSVIGVALGNSETGKTPSGTPANTVEPSVTPSGNTVEPGGEDPNGRRISRPPRRKRRFPGRTLR